MEELEKLWNSTGDAHSTIQGETHFLCDIAARVRYLHPDLAADLSAMAKRIESARQTIQGNTAEEVNIKLRESMQASAELLSTLLGNAAD